MMMRLSRNSIQTLLASNASEVCVNQFGQQVTWIPILQWDNMSGTRKLGLTEDGNWAVYDKRGLLILDNEDEFLWAITLIEKPFREVYSQVSDFFRRFGVSIDVEQAFPFDIIIRNAVRRNSEYWAKLAVDWYEGMSDTIKQDMIDVLQEIINAKWASQSLRHRCQRNLRGLRP